MAGSSKDTSGATASTSLDPRDFIDDNNSDDSSEESSEEPETRQVSKRIRVVEDIFGDYSSDSDDDLSVVIDERAGTSNSIAAESPEVDGEEVDTGNVKDCAANSNKDDYTVDVNDNSGRIVLKILKH